MAFWWITAREKERRRWTVARAIFLRSFPPGDKKNALIRDQRSLRALAERAVILADQFIAEYFKR